MNNGFSLFFSFENKIIQNTTKVQSLYICILYT